MALGTAPSAYATLVYDNSVNDLLSRFNPGTVEVGDQIILAGGATAYVPTSFVFQYFLVGNGIPPGAGTIASAVIRFYANDGVLFNGYSTPGTKLWDSGPFSVTGTTRQALAFGASDLTGVTLPSTFTWSIQFSDIPSGERAGVDLYGPVSVGQNYVDYWHNTGTELLPVWELREFPGGTPAVDFAAMLEAELIPEPSTVATAVLFGFGAIAFVRGRRHRAF